MPELPDDLAGEVQRLREEAEECVDEDQFEDARALFQSAWNLLPEPKGDWEPSLQILAALADVHYFRDEWQACYDTLQQAIRICDAPLDNPFIRLRLGQSLFELGDREEAAHWMAPAYLMEGQRLFEGEDPKYLAFLKERLQPPPGGWPEGW